MHLNELLFSPLVQIKPESLEQRLGTLMRRYLRTRSPALARLVVRHIEALCAHPGYHATPEQRCVYRKMAAHWRCLAARNTRREYPQAAKIDF